MNEPTIPATGNIHMAMAAIMRDVDPIRKERENKEQRFKFRGIDDVLNALHAVFASHGVFCLPVAESIVHTSAGKTSGGAEKTRAVVMMGYRFTASDGSFVEAKVPGEGIDASDKSCAKAMSVAFKVLLLQTFLIETEDTIDGDFYDPTVMPREELARRQQMKEMNDREAMTAIMNQHLENAELASTDTEKKRLQGLASEVRCKIEELDHDAEKKLAAANQPPPEPKDWKDVVCHIGNAGGRIKDKTLAEIFCGDLKKAIELSGWFKKKYMPDVAILIDNHKAKKAGPPIEDDVTLYRALLEVEPYLAERESMEAGK